MDEILGQITLTSKALAGAMAASYVLQLMSPYALKLFGLVAGKTLTCVWMIVTSAIMEDNLLNVFCPPYFVFSVIAPHLFNNNDALNPFQSLLLSALQLLISILGVLVLTRIVEPVYGTREFIKFLLVSIAGSGALTFIFVSIIYYGMLIATKYSADHAADILYYPICGFQGGIAALLVGVKHVIPDNDVMLFNFIHFRARHLAVIYVLTLLAFSLVAGGTIKLVPFAMYAMFTAWFYIRFFYLRPETGSRGEPADNFRFASFFPEAVQPPVDALANACSTITGLKVSGQSAYQQLTSMPPASDSDAERRRQRGAKALEERLGIKASAAAHPSSSPVKLPPAADEV